MTNLGTAATAEETRGWPHGPTSFERRRGNALTRVVAGAIGIPIVLGAVWLGGWAFFIFVSLAIIGAMLEFYWIVEAKGARPHKLLGVVFGLLLAFVFFHGVSDAFLSNTLGVGASSDPVYVPRLVAIVSIIIVLVVSCLIVEMRRDDAAPIINNSTTILGVVYVGLFLATVIGIRQLFSDDPLMIAYVNSALDLPAGRDVVARYGAYMVMAVLVTIWICDSAAYYVGRAMGRHKMAPSISPKKTWEGGIGGAVFAIATMITFQQLLLDFLSIGNAIVLGLIVGILGQVGDLAESHLKRDAGVKDSSQLIPGHGGVFDRFDSLMFVAPLVYLYLTIIAATA
ncbi:MAG: phosphatidate cytidylyltransferase [bacterium]|nr:phosphatidate cytidylyltransferase [Candidatus Kapabacteria bacterium]